MARTETDIAFRTFALLSGIRQEPDDFIAVIEPGSNARQRKGTLALLTEPAGDHPALGVDACRLAIKAIADGYYADNALSLTSSLLSALESANNALLQYNFSQGAGAPMPVAEGALAVQTGGARSKRARVALTAVV